MATPPRSPSVTEYSDAKFCLCSCCMSKISRLYKERMKGGNGEKYLVICEKQRRSLWSDKTSRFLYKAMVLLFDTPTSWYNISAITPHHDSSICDMTNHALCGTWRIDAGEDVVDRLCLTVRHVDVLIMPQRYDQYVTRKGSLCCSVLHFVVVCCGVALCCGADVIAVVWPVWPVCHKRRINMLQCVAVCCSVL